MLGPGQSHHATTDPSSRQFPLMGLSTWSPVNWKSGSETQFVESGAPSFFQPDWVAAHCMGRMLRYRVRAAGSMENWISMALVLEMLVTKPDAGSRSTASKGPSGFLSMLLPIWAGSVNRFANV